MVTYNSYLKGLAANILKSFEILSNLNDKSDDLRIMEIELLKIKGFLHVLSNKIESDKYPSIDIQSIQAKSKAYLETYDFEREINNVSMLYADDSNRIKNLRLLILASLNDKKLISGIGELAREI